MPGKPLTFILVPRRPVTINLFMRLGTSELYCMMISVAVVLLLLGFVSSIQCQTYVLDDSIGLGRRFDGIGGLSGGGVSIMLIVCLQLRRVFI